MGGKGEPSDDLVDLRDHVIDVVIGAIMERVPPPSAHRTLSRQEVMAAVLTGLIHSIAFILCAVQRDHIFSEYEVNTFIQNTTMYLRDSMAPVRKTFYETGLGSGQPEN